MNKVRKLAVISIAVAMAVVLDYIKEFIPFLNMPSGGSINIALIPVVLISFMYSYKEGIVTGFAWWLVSSLLGFNNWFISIGQYICDYVLPSVIPGLSSIFFEYFKKKDTEKDFVFEMTGIILAFIVRAGVQIYSGAAFWPSDGAAFSKASWIFSIGYNLPYNIATAVVICLTVPLLINRLKHIVIK